MYYGNIDYREVENMNDEFENVNSINEEVNETENFENPSNDEIKSQEVDDENNLGDNFEEADFTVKSHSSEKKKRTWTRVVALSLVAGIVAGTGFSFTSEIARKFVLSNIPIGSTKVMLSESKDQKDESSAIATIAEECMPSIVAITNRGESDVMTFFGRYTQENTSSGSGIIIGKNENELLIVTNFHVVANSKELSVIFSPVEEKLESVQNEAGASSVLKNNKNIPNAVVKGYNSDKDLAVIAVKLKDIPSEIFSKIKTATIGDSSKLKRGDSVIAIGNALGYGQSVTTGIISAVNRKITMEASNGTSLVTNAFIQTDAAINPGNSGGALLNMKGELIGINSVKIASNGVEGMGYAIPISDVGNIIDELMIKKTRNVVDEDKQGFLGITGSEVTSSAAESFNMPMGVFVSSVMEGLAADKAGIKKGYIITEIDGYKVSTIADIQQRLTYYKAGEKVKVTANVQSEKGYKEKVFEVKLSNRSESIEEAEE